MRYLPLLILLISSCDDGALVPFCNSGKECWIDANAGVVLSTELEFRAHTGAESTCQLGVTTCDEEDKLVCDGFVGPQEEICNGIDDNCNYVIDEVQDIVWFDDRNECNDLTITGFCSLYNTKCLNGVLACVPVVAREPEKCDGFDNDCDGVINEDTIDEPLYEERWIYTGPWETEGVGECRPGRKRCDNGNTIVEGEILPNTEACNNQRDDDCDGLTDEVEDPNYAGAFTLVLDVSGSMWGTIDNVTTALCNWSQDGLLSGSRFSVVFIGFAAFEAVDEIILGSDFVTSAELCAYLNTTPWDTYSGGNEYQPAGIMQSHQVGPMIYADGSVAQGQVHSWPEGLDKHVVVFSDERIQFRPGESDADVINSCQQNQYSVGIFTDNYNYNQWTNIISLCGGFKEDVFLTEEDLEQKLLFHFVGGC